jgi:hypothetical protein
MNFEHQNCLSQNIVRRILCTGLVKRGFGKFLYPTNSGVAVQPLLAEIRDVFSRPCMMYTEAYIIDKYLLIYMYILVSVVGRLDIHIHTHVCSM